MHSEESEACAQSYRAGFIAMLGGIALLSALTVLALREDYKDGMAERMKWRAFAAEKQCKKVEVSRDKNEVAYLCNDGLKYWRSARD